MCIIFAPRFKCAIYSFPLALTYAETDPEPNGIKLVGLGTKITTYIFCTSYRNIIAKSKL